MRAGRLVALLLLVQRQGATTADRLADALEVSVRTIYRDVSALQAAGVPLWTEPGRHGGIRLVEGWQTRLDGLTADEAGVLFLAGAPGAAGELGLGTVLVAAQAKVMATLPPELRSRAGRVRQRFHLDAPGWFQRPDEVPHLPVIADAVWSDRRIDVRYERGRTHLVARRLDPLGLVLKAGTWYLVARHRGDMRTYRLGRIKAATARAEHFARPEGFDLAAWWQSSSQAFDRSILRERVRVRLSPLGVRLLPAFTDSAAAAEAIAHADPRDADGWRTVDLAVESHDVACSQLTALGAEFEVVSPPSLRAAIAAVGDRIVRQHAGVAVGASG